MRQDVVSFQRFYSSPLGGVAARAMQRRLTDLWSQTNGLSMLGLGYALPLLEPFTEHTTACIAAIPSEYGRARWDAAGRGNAAVSVGDRLPFSDGRFDRVIVLHGLEDAGRPQAYLREIWRVTAPEGRIVLAVANRAGIWCRATQTPFGTGRPWTKSQLSALLSGGLFQVTASTHALHMPPISWRLITSAAEGWESGLGRVAPALGGVVLIEAVKRLYAKPGGGAVAPALEAIRVSRPRPATNDTAAPPD